MRVVHFTTDNGVSAVRYENAPYIDLAKTFDCGQCFRFEPVSVFGNRVEFGGVAFGMYVIFAQNHENEVIVYNATEYDANTWITFLNLDKDYGEINSSILDAVPTEHMQKAVSCGNGIRILSQNLWECLASFIISQNNNIPRIKKIVDTLCRTYGDKIEFMGSTYYAFPDPDVLIKATDVDLAEKTRMGFRAKYVISAARWFFTNDQMRLRLSTYNDDLENLCKINGVGPKVASCVLLFSVGRGEAFPIDVHMKRTLEKYFPQGIDLDALGDNAGIAQQYLFYYEKYIKSLE